MPRAVATPAPGRLYVPWGMLAAIDVHGCAGRLANRDSIRARVTVAALRPDVWPGRAAHAAEGDLPIARHDQLTAKQVAAALAALSRAAVP